MPESRGWNILLVDDDEDDFILTRQMLVSNPRQKSRLEWASTYEAGQQAFCKTIYDVVLMDYDLGYRNGLDLIRQAAQMDYPAPIILLTGRGSYDVDVEAMQAGATLYLTKGESNPLLLERAIRYAIERKQAEEELARANQMLLQQKNELQAKNCQLEAEIIERVRLSQEVEKLVVDLSDALAEAERSRAQLEAVFTSQIDVVILYDTHRNVIRVNPVFNETYGFDPVGLNVRDVIRRVDCRSRDGQPLVLEDQPTPRALRGEKVPGATFLVRNAQGKERVVETSSGPMWINQQITGSVTVWHDITDLVRIEEALQDLKNKTG